MWILTITLLTTQLAAPESSVTLARPQAKPSLAPLVKEVIVNAPITTERLELAIEP